MDVRFDSGPGASHCHLPCSLLRLKKPKRRM
jgi:hypothetical protein